jgi:hypothetical protein
VAELELAVSYRTKPARIGLYTMMALMPVWAIGVPFCLGLYIVLLIKTPVPFLAAALILAMLLLIPAVSILLAALFEDDRITVSKEGISLPIRFLPALGFRRERLWNDLSDVMLIAGPTDDRNQLSLKFHSGGEIRLDASSISKSDMEQFLLATEVWGKSCNRQAELITYQNRLQNENRGVDHLSYTQMWEEELSRRFSATSFVPLEPGRILQDGRYKVIRQLAFGGLSAIYLAQKDELELVVLKEAVVPANADENSRKKATELFDREARFLIRLNHPNIAHVYDHFADQNRNYLVLEYIRGQDLRQFVKQNGAQPEQLVLRWATQIASILDYLHSQSPPIIHRDLTPDNLVHKDDETIVLIDFGAANEFVGTATGTLVGKQAYIAPEQLRGKATTSSDIYALGGTLHFLLTGKDPDALMTSHPREHQPVSSLIDKIVEDCTQMEESDRPGKAADLVSRFQALTEPSDEERAKAGTAAGAGSDETK